MWRVDYRLSIILQTGLAQLLLPSSCVEHLALQANVALAKVRASHPGNTPYTVSKHACNRVQV